MDERKLEIIMQLMEELKSEMQPDEKELGARLGREPKVEVVSMESDDPMEGDDFAMEGDFEDDALKKRLMKLRA